MTPVAQKVDDFLHQYQMHPSLTDVDACTQAFYQDIHRGLQGQDDAWMLMLPTYLTVADNIPQEEPVIVIDAGGTNFRIGLVTMTADGPKIEDLTVSPMPGSSQAITWTQFVEQVAQAILPFTNRSRRVGLCFSYASESLPNQDGRVIKFTKQVVITDSENQELGRDISASLAEKGVPGVGFVVLNDTVAALLGGIASLKDETLDGHIGLIYGTGVNTCYAQSTDALATVTTPWPYENMIINMESAQFEGGVMGTFDKRLDDASLDPGMCLYEKMVSGRYAGEVVYYTLLQAAQDGLFSPHFAQVIQGLDTLPMVEADRFVRMPYGDGLLAQACQTEADREGLYLIIDRIVERAARLVCANLASILLQTGTGKLAHRPACIVAEGSSFHKGYLFRGKLERLCQDYVTDQLGLHLVFRQVEDANLLGTAAAALLNQ